MVETPSLTILLLIAAVVLIVATCVGYVLTTYRSSNQSSILIDNFNAYIISWWGMTAMLAIACLGGRIGVIVLFAFCSFAALREFLTLTTKNRDDYWVLAAAFFAILPIQYILLGAQQTGLFFIFIPVYSFLFLPVIAVIRGNTDNFLIRVAETQWALMIAVYCGSHIPALLDLDIKGFDGRNVLLIAFLVIIVQASDFCEFMFSRLFGKTKIAPTVARSKTWEGALGALVSGTVLGWALWWLTPFGMLPAAALAFFTAGSGFLANMVMAAIRHDKGVKDWGNLIPGHGGFIDRLGAVVYTAPIYYHLVRYFWAEY